ncbi:hypothetical protein [Promicromonospora sp. NPDC059942]|uniref:hypothetical protein n=1 Tax=Promicromonospora sp. NPDC059942 TaxID=3347009 RepID=UPI00365978EB
MTSTSPNSTVRPRNGNRAKPYPASVASTAVSTAVDTDTIAELRMPRQTSGWSITAWKLTQDRSKNRPSGAATITSPGCPARTNATTSGTRKTSAASVPPTT